MNEEKRLLYRLSELDYFEISDDEVDVHDWEVYGSDGVKIGEVDDYIVDPGAMKVRYLEVTLDEDLPDAGRPILIPIGEVKIDEKDDRIIVNKLNRSSLQNYPIFQDEIITRSYENSIRHIYHREFITVPDPELNFYENPIYDDSTFRTARRMGRI